MKNFILCALFLLSAPIMAMEAEDSPPDDLVIHNDSLHDLKFMVNGVCLDSIPLVKAHTVYSVKGEDFLADCASNPSNCWVKAFADTCEGNLLAGYEMNNEFGYNYSVPASGYYVEGTEGFNLFLAELP